MSDNAATRHRISLLLDDIEQTTRALWVLGVDPSQPEDREALAIIKRIIERSYAADDLTRTAN